MPKRDIHTSTAASRRSTGLLIAAAFALIGAGIVLYVAVGHKREGADGSGKGSPLPGDVVDIGKAPTTDRSSDVGPSVDGRLQFEDKNRPGRLAAELAYKKLDPVGQGYYSITQPRAWIYLKDGRTLHVRADSGRIKRPSGGGGDIESGDFRGEVVLKVFNPPVESTGKLVSPINPDSDTPVLMAVMDSVSFDSVLVELSTPDTVTISTPNLLFEGDGLRIRGNQVRERIELLHTKGKFVRYNPKYKAPKAETKVASGPKGPTPPTGQVAPATPASTPGAATQTAAAPASGGATVTAPITPAPPAAATAIKEVLYKATFTDNLTVLQAGRKLESDTLDVFARVIDSKFPDGTFGVWDEPSATNASSTAVSGAGQAAPSKPVINPNARPAGEAVAVASTKPPEPAPLATAAATGSPSTTKKATLFQSAGDDDVVMTWTGSLVMTPLDKSGPELEDGNHFAARFSSEKPDGRAQVVMTDTQTKGRIECAALEYAATKQLLALQSGPGAPKVLGNVPGTGQLEIPSVRVNLATGLAHIPGGGLLASLRPTSKGVSVETALTPVDVTMDQSIAIAPELARQITWTEQADIQFRTRGGRIAGAIDWASFSGNVLARDRLSVLSGDFIKSEFMAVGTQESALKKVHVEGKAFAIAGPKVTQPDFTGPLIDPYISADTLDIAFIPSKVDPNETDPVRAIAVGSVRGANRDANIRARRVEAVIARDARNSLVATNVDADGQVLFERSDGTTARCDLLRANPVHRTADLTGQPVAIGYGNSTILGSQMALDDAAGSMVVFGSGSFEHLQSAGDGVQVASADGASIVNPKSTRVTATWTKSMIFNNTRGTIECSGDTVVSSVGPTQTQTLRAERLNLWLTPASDGSSQANAAPDNDRKLLKAEAIGASQEKDGAPNATVETRRYAAATGGGSGERVLEQLFFVEGAKIIADDVKGTVTVPIAGRAIVRDQRQAASQGPLAPNTPAVGHSGVPLIGGAKGTSRFTWGESMEFTRATGTLTMRRDVELVHLPLGSDQATRIVAMQMDAKFNVQGDPNNPRSAELVRADATGAVYAESGTQKLLADSFSYDALSGIADVAAFDNNRVTLYDDRKASPLVAKKLRWDLVRDRVDITEMAPVTSPR